MDWLIRIRIKLRTILISILNFLIKSFTTFLQKLLAETELRHTATEKIYKDIIYMGVKNERDLAQIKNHIEKEFKKSLGIIDNNFIERKYIKYCGKFLQKDIKIFFEIITESENQRNDSWISSMWKTLLVTVIEFILSIIQYFGTLRRLFYYFNSVRYTLLSPIELIQENKNVILKVFNSLDYIQKLEQIPYPLNQFKYYILLMKHYKSVSKIEEENILRQFKNEILIQARVYYEFLDEELIFMNSFVDFLNYSKNWQSIIRKLELNSLCQGTKSFDELVKNIEELEVNNNVENLRDLQEATRKILSKVRPFFLMDHFIKVVKDCIKSTKIQETKKDGRLIIEVIGNIIVVSEILPELEVKLKKNSNIEEVRFVCTNIIHIDSNLENEIWHGRNVAIFTKILKIHNEVTWNVSGKDNNHVYSSNAGVGKNGHGRRGKDGYPGEGGGNVLILLEKIEDPDNFIIISNGGRGSNGQNGGDGDDGEDGTGISKKELKNKFPSASRFFGFNSSENLKKILKNIKKDSSTIKTVWYGNSITKIEKIITDIDNSWVEASIKSIFIETETIQRRTIIYSFYTSIFCGRQDFMLYQGSLGMCGKPGGEYGLGGEGGYAGEIKIKNIEDETEYDILTDNNQGAEGNEGQGGLYGKFGKNGLDIAYTDYEKWFDVNIFDEGKYKINYFSNSSDDRIWCPYNRKYAEITAANIEHKKKFTYEERMNTRQNSNRQHYARAIKNKTISQESMKTDYCHCIGKKILQDLQNHVNEKKKLTSKAENLEQEKQTTETKHTRIAKSVSQYRNKPRNVCSTVNYKDNAMNKLRDEVIKNIKDKPQLSNWLQLKNVELICADFDDLFFILQCLEESDQKRDIKSKLKNIIQLLSDKFIFAILREIEKELINFEVKEFTSLTFENAVRYLVKVNIGDNNISNPDFGTLNQYLYQHNEEKLTNILDKNKKNLQDTYFKALKCSMKTFVLTIENLEEHTDIKVYYDDYKEFLTKQECSIDVFIRVFGNVQHLFDSCIKDIKDASVKSKLEKDIKYVFFEVFDHFNELFEQEYDWSKCCNDDNVFTKYYKFIKKNGPFSNCFRELLAHLYNINIRLYDEDKTGLFPKDEHNPSCKDSIYLLDKANKLMPLNINQNYLNLDVEREMKNDVYTNCFREIDNLKNATDLVVKSISEEECIQKIVEYFPDEEKSQLKVRLEKINSQFVGQQGILRNIYKSFLIDGKHISYMEMCCLINSVLALSIEDRKVQNTFSWIIAAHSQRNWIDEVILLQLENCLKTQLEEKSKWRDYLSKTENINVLLLFSVKLNQSNTFSTKCIDDILYTLSSMPRETFNLEELELSEWPYVLKEKYWSCKISSLINQKNSEESESISYYLLSMENLFGIDLVDKLLKVLKEKHQLSTEKLTKILYNFHSEKWNLSESEINSLKDCDIDEWIKQMRDFFSTNNEERNVTALVKLIANNANSSTLITNSLVEIKECINRVKKHVNSYRENDIKNWVKTLNDIDSPNDFNNMLTVIDRAIELKRRFKLRDTQKLTILTLLKNNRNTLAQVSTGEGKSLIVVAVSIIKALCREKVDIITSSSVLAKRDANSNKDIYSLFEINVSHNCDEDIEKRKQGYSNNQVIYGDISSFQRDYLIDKFYGKNILGDRDFKNVIVDEVDSMMLDKGNNMLYLSHDIACLDQLEPVYVYIWQWINRPAINNEDISYAFNVKEIQEKVINELYGLIKKDDIDKLGPELNEQSKKNIWEHLVKTGILDNQGKLLVEIIDDNKLDDIVLPEISTYKDRLHYLLNDCIEREKLIHVPNYLKPFVENHLEAWINSAITAFLMIAEQDYVVDVDRSGTSSDHNPNITIIDRDTGTDQANSQWDEALHQFLQLKHGCKLSLQSLKAVFISNVSFFKLYNKLYGLTGTLGSQRERNLLQQMYTVDFVTIPTAKFKQFHEDKPILCASKEEWINEIKDEVNKIITRERSILIICETMSDVEVLRKSFEGKHVYTYTRDYEEFDIAQGNEKLKGRQIIIATNLAGRGTDIKITESLRREGGLHICLTYLPKNIRIEQQAFGRAARNGDKGSGRLIFIDSTGRNNSNSRILHLKKERDLNELYRILEIKAHFETQISIEENCFEKFKEQYEQLKKKVDDEKVPTEAKQILLQSCLDKWAFWLDENLRRIKNMTDEQNKNNFYQHLENFLLNLKKLHTIKNDLKDKSESWLAWVEDNPIQMIKLGKFLFQNNQYEYANTLFDKVIKKEQYFSETAHYYKAFVLTKLREDLKEIKNELQKSAKLFEERRKSAIISAAIIGTIKKKYNNNIIQINSYEEQKNNIANFYQIFSQTILDIFGHPITPQSFESAGIEKELAETIYNDLIENKILKRLRIKKNISEEKLKIVCFDYGILVETLNKFLSGYREINAKEFLKTLKKEIPLPSRETLWKLLIEEKILTNEEKIVVVNNEKLKQTFPLLFTSLNNIYIKKQLKQQTLNPRNDQILLNVEWITLEKNNSNIFKKDDYIENVGKYMYEILKEKGLLSVTKKAHINTSRIESSVLSSYDSITIDDFTDKANISSQDADKIFEELIELSIIEKRNDTNDDVYRLKIKFDQINLIQLPSCPVYEDTVRKLLCERFTYRLVLQKIEKQIQQENFPIQIQLTTNPHEILFSDLLEQKIIKPSVVETEEEDLEKRIRSIYKEELTASEFIHLLSQENFVTETSKEDLFNCLVEKKCIIKNAYNNLFYINSTYESQMHLDYSKEINEVLKKFLDKRLRLTRNDTIRYIIGTLNKSRNLLKNFKKYNSELKSLIKYTNKEEVYVFILNGLDQLLKFEEKWYVIFLNKVRDIYRVIKKTVSLIINLCWQTLKDNSDLSINGIWKKIEYIINTVRAIYSKNFSLDFYKFVMDSIQMAINTYHHLLKTAKKMRFGHKLAEIYNNFNTERETCEFPSTADVTDKVEKEKGSFLKVIERMVVTEDDRVIKNYLQNFYENMGFLLLSNMLEDVEKHNIFLSVKKAYEALGEKCAKEMMNNLIENVLSDESVLENFSPITYKIYNCIIQDIKKRIKSNKKLELSISCISEIVVWTDRLLHIAEMKKITDKLLNNINQKINNELSKSKKNLNRKRGMEGDYKSFEKEIIDQWKSLFREKAKKYIIQYIVNPLLKEVDRLVKRVEKKIQSRDDLYEENENIECFDQLKRDYKKKLQSEKQCDNTYEIEYPITRKYHEHLENLMIKTGNPMLLAAIIRENIPMHVTCISACQLAILKMLKERNFEISRFTITVEGDDGVVQKFPSASHEAEGKIIAFPLRDNHFLLCESDISNRNDGSKTLYEVIESAIPKIRTISPNDFQAEVANYIEKDSEIQKRIQQDWNRIEMEEVIVNEKINVTSDNVKMTTSNFHPAKWKQRAREFQKYMFSSEVKEKTYNKKSKNHDIDVREQFIKIFESLENSVDCTQIPPTNIHYELDRKMDPTKVRDIALKTFKKSVINKLNEHINSGNYNEILRAELQNAIYKINDITSESLL